MILNVYPFQEKTIKEAALKPLEEASEIHGSWQAVCDGPKGASEDDFADEIADCIQACVNLASLYDLNLEDALDRVYRRNIARGRYPDAFFSDNEPWYPSGGGEK